MFQKQNLPIHYNAYLISAIELDLESLSNSRSSHKSILF